LIKLEDIVLLKTLNKLIQRWSFIVCIGVMSLVAQFVLPLVTHAVPVHVIHDQVFFMYSDSKTPPADGVMWQLVTLPDNWDVTHQGKGGFAWYRIERHLNAVPQDEWSMFIERCNMNAAVYVGHTLIGSGGSFEEPVSRNWATPLLFSIPKPLLNEGVNTFYIRMFAYANDGGGIASYQLGATSMLMPQYQSMVWHYTIVSEMIFSVLVTAAFFMLLLWVSNRHKVEFAWIALGSISGAMFNANMFVQHIPVAQWAWFSLVNASIGWFVVSLMMVGHSFLNIQSKKLERCVIVFTALGTMFFFVAPYAVSRPFVFVWMGFFAVVAVYLFFESVYYSFKQIDVFRLGWLVAFMVMLASGVHDWTMIVTTQGYFFDVYFHMGIFGFVLLSVFVIVIRFLHYIKETKQLNTQLLQKVDRFEAELDKQHAVDFERHRIMKDLHDSVGNSLVSAMALSHAGTQASDALQQTLKSALEEMRFIVTAAKEMKLDSNLSMIQLHKQTALVCQSLDIDLLWSVERPLNELFIDAVKQSHVLYIMQESIGNTLKHAQATKLRIKLDEQENNVVLIIGDNGVGMDMQTVNHGNGLQHLYSRAQDMNAEIHIQSNESGTIITISIPNQ